MSLVCVIGSTGIQGGSVIQALLNNPKWKVRGLTRNTSSKSASRLREKGVEIVNADVNDEISLVKTFQGAAAIFAVTAFWESIPKLGRNGAGQEEKQQIMNIANAAARTPTLKHFILSSLPSPEKMSKGRFPVPHFDYKDDGFIWIQQNLPDLARKMTAIWVGWYSLNMLNSPMFMPVQLPISQSYIWMQPSSPDAILSISGDTEINTGIVVEGILEAADKAYGKTVLSITDKMTFTEALAIWQRVTGKNAAVVPVSDEIFAQLWGAFGEEIATQFRWSEQYDEWTEYTPEGVEFVTLEELGLKGKLVNFESYLKRVCS